MVRDQMEESGSVYNHVAFVTTLKLLLVAACIHFQVCLLT